MEGGEHGRASDCIDRLDQAVWAVSYTHLDVYKRQVPKRTALAVLISNGWQIAN